MLKAQSKKRSFCVGGRRRFRLLAGCEVGVWLEDDDEDAAKLPCLSFRWCDFADGFFGVSYGVCGAFSELAVICENGGVCWVFSDLAVLCGKTSLSRHSEVLASFRNSRTLPAL